MCNCFKLTAINKTAVCAGEANWRRTERRSTVRRWTEKQGSHFTSFSLRWFCVEPLSLSFCHLVWKWILHSEGFLAVWATLYWPSRSRCSCLAVIRSTKLHSMRPARGKMKKMKVWPVIHNQVISSPFGAAEQWCDCDRLLGPNYQTNFLLNGSSSQPPYLIKFSRCSLTAIMMERERSSRWMMKLRGRGGQAFANNNWANLNNVSWCSQPSPGLHSNHLDCHSCSPTLW